MLLFPEKSGMKSCHADSAKKKPGTHEPGIIKIGKRSTNGL